MKNEKTPSPRKPNSVGVGRNKSTRNTINIIIILGLIENGEYKYMENVVRQDSFTLLMTCFCDSNPAQYERNRKFGHLVHALGRSAVGAKLDPKTGPNGGEGLKGLKLFQNWIKEPIRNKLMH